MKFALDDMGADSVVKGLSGMFKSAALAPLMRDQAEQKSALNSAQIYSHNMSGNKAGAQAEQEQFTLGQRKGVDDQLTDPALAPYMKNMLRAFKLTGDTNADRVSKSALNFQTAGFRDNAADNVADPDTMNRYVSLAANKVYEPFGNIGNTGTVYNKATGDGKVASDVLDKLFGRKTESEINQHNAAAGNSSAHAGLARAQTDFTRWKMTPDDSGGAGKPLTNAQLRANEEVDAARTYLKDVPRDTIAKVMNKSEFDMTPADKDLMARIKKGRLPKYGEKGVPTDMNEMLGLDRNVVNALANELAAPPLQENSGISGAVAKLFGKAPGRQSEQDVIDRVKQNLPEGERQNIGQYVTTAKAKNRTVKNPMIAPANDNMAGNSLLEQARAAISKGAPRDKVIERLQQKGVNPAGL